MEASIRYRVVLATGKGEVGEELYHVLSAIEKHGSLLSASRTLGIPYTRVWELLARAEKILGVKLVETRRGGRGGARLTREARRVVRLFEEGLAALEKCAGPQAPRTYYGSSGARGVVVAYSSDPLIELVLEKVADLGVGVEGVCLGSGLSLALLSLGEADVACIHLYDAETGEYNRPYLRRYWVEEPILLGGYCRELVLAYRPGLSYAGLDELLRDIVSGRLRIVNRNRGSGTRVMFEWLVERYAREKGIEPRLVGAENIAYTHEEAARKVALGKADAAPMIRYAAELYGLKWAHLVWERYECFTVRARLNTPGVRLVKEVLGSEWLRRLLVARPGYSPSCSSGAG